MQNDTTFSTQIQLNMYFVIFVCGLVYHQKLFLFYIIGRYKKIY